MSTDIQTEFEKAVGIAVKKEVLGSSKTTLFIGGPLQYFIEPNNVEELKNTSL